MVADRLLVGGLVASLMVVSTSLVQARREAGAQRQEVTDAQRELARARVFQDALRDVVTHAPLDQPILTGDTAFGEVSALLASPHWLVYVFDPDCAACAPSVPLLNTLDDAGLHVVGVTGDSNVERVLQFAADAAIRFPIITHPNGTLWELTPRNVTPLTFIGGHNQVSALIIGVLDSNAARDLRALTQATPGR